MISGLVFLPRIPDIIRLRVTLSTMSSDKLLRELFGQGRAIVMKGKKSGAERLENLRGFVTDRNHGDLGSHRHDLSNLPESIDTTFLLFRRRGEALEASSYLRTWCHRVRMSSLPTVIHDWIGKIFWDWVQPEMDEGEFKLRWGSVASFSRFLQSHIRIDAKGQPLLLAVEAILEAPPLAINPCFNLYLRTPLDYLGLLGTM